MLTIASLLAALTIAGAFWVGILAAKRLRDWGDGRRLGPSDDGKLPLALAAAAVPISQDLASQRVRLRVAERIRHRLPPETLPRSFVNPNNLEQAELDVLTLRQGDVVIIDNADPTLDGDYLVDGIVKLREGMSTTAIVVMNDGNRKRWLIASPEAQQWLFVEPVAGHGLVGEPPRNIHQQGRLYTLERRGQASAAGLGMHERPALPRVATYLYRAEPEWMLWVERWSEQIWMGQGKQIPSHVVQFLPGSS